MQRNLPRVWKWLSGESVRSDVNRLRYALLKDLVEDAYNPTAVQLQGELLF